MRIAVLEDFVETVDARLFERLRRVHDARDRVEHATPGEPFAGAVAELVASVADLPEQLRTKHGTVAAEWQARLEKLDRLEATNAALAVVRLRDARMFLRDHFPITIPANASDDFVDHALDDIEASVRTGMRGTIDQRVSSLRSIVEQRVRVPDLRTLARAVGVTSPEDLGGSPSKRAIAERLAPFLSVRDEHVREAARWLQPWLEAVEPGRGGSFDWYIARLLGDVGRTRATRRQPERRSKGAAERSLADEKKAAGPAFR